MKTSELTGAALDWAVAKCEGATNLRYDTVATWWVDLNGEPRALSSGWSTKQNFHPSANPAQAYPIIDRDHISTVYVYWGEWEAWDDKTMPPPKYRGPTPLIAAMRCRVASKLGDEVDVPEELI